MSQTISIEKIRSDLRAGKYVDTDLATAFRLIFRRESEGDEVSRTNPAISKENAAPKHAPNVIERISDRDRDTFLENGPCAVLETEFSPCIGSDNLFEHIRQELGERAPECGVPLVRRLDEILRSAAIYLQRYDIEVPGSKGRIFIYRTPSKNNFDRARSAVLFVLEFFRQAAEGDVYVAVGDIYGVTMTIRGMENFFDINIKSGLNTEAWIGFDFR